MFVGRLRVVPGGPLILCPARTSSEGYASRLFFSKPCPCRGIPTRTYFLQSDQSSKSAFRLREVAFNHKVIIIPTSSYLFHRHDLDCLAIQDFKERNR